MRFCFLIVFLFLSLSASAQTVEKVTGPDAMITIQGSESVSVGDKVRFLDDELNISGEGEVTYVSEDGKKGLVKIISGKASVGMSLEKNSGSKPATKVATPEPESTSSISTSSLSDDERKILNNGEITPLAHIAGGLLATYPIGLGIGHAVQGRYMEKGWIFTLGELASLSAIVAGVGDCTENYSYSSSNGRYSCGGGGMVVLGLFGYVGFRIWEAVDAWVGPFELNRRHREIKMRMEPRVKLEGFALAPTNDGAMLGMKLTF